MARVTQADLTDTFSVAVNQSVDIYKLHEAQKAVNELQAGKNGLKQVIVDNGMRGRFGVPLGDNDLTIVIEYDEDKNQDIVKDLYFGRVPALPSP